MIPATAVLTESAVNQCRFDRRKFHGSTSAALTAAKTTPRHEAGALPVCCVKLRCAALAVRVFLFTLSLAALLLASLTALLATLAGLSWLVPMLLSGLSLLSALLSISLHIVCHQYSSIRSAGAVHSVL